MKRDHTLAVLALNAGALVFHSTNDTLQLEAFAVNLVQTHWCLRCHHWPWDPHSTAQVYPFIKSLGWWHITCLQQLVVPLQEEVVVFRTLSHYFRL
jgi:hypothetical protein